MQTARNNKLSLGRIAKATLAVIPFALGSAILITPRPARAEAVTFSNSKREYKVGILLIDSTTDFVNAPIKGPENPDPHVFYVADQRTDIKPGGWDLVNPLAPATVTSDIFGRWSGLGGRDPGHPYAVGQKVTKDMAAYWEVSLSKASEAELLQFDVLFITNHRAMRFTPKDREKLRKVVDAGGVVWLDDCGGMRIEPSGRFFLDEMQFQGSSAGLNGMSGPAIYQPAHPLLTSPYTLSYTDILNLGDKSYGNYYLASFKPNAINLNDVVPDRAPNQETLKTIIGNNYQEDTTTKLAMPYISAGLYGSGSLIVSCADIGCGVNDYTGGFNAGSGGNSGAYAGTNLQAANIEDLKFTYNAIAWGSANNTVRRNNRRTASSSSAVSVPLNPSFNFAQVPPAAIDPIPRVSSNSSPLISQGIMYVAGVDSNGNATLRAYDTVPNRDYDNDGNNDDGRPDLIYGTPYDEIWRWPGAAYGGAEPSSPALASVPILDPDGATRPHDVVMITMPDGTVNMFDARPVDFATNRLLPTNVPLFTNGPVGSGNYAAVGGNVAPSPIFYANKVYVSEPTGGLVRCINATDFKTLWKSTEKPGPFDIVGTPTLGLNRLVVNKTHGSGNENTIAVNTDESTNDVMLYVPVRDTSTTPASEKILPYWLGTRGEGTKDINFDGTNYTMRMRPASTNLDQFLIPVGGVGSGFITPSVVLYADVTVSIGGIDTLFTREENFAAGRAVYPKADPFFSSNGYGLTWAATWEASTVNPAYYSGRINVTVTGGSVPSANVPTKVLAVADYDLTYVPQGTGSGPGPVYLTDPTNAQPGNRNALPFTIPGGTGLETVAFATNDLLLYAANQTGTAGTAGALSAMQEREFSLSASRMRWRYLLHDGYTHEINTVSVTDRAALVDKNNAAITGVTIKGSPITTNDGVTYQLAQSAGRSILMAFDTSPQITLKLGTPLAANSSVQVSQYDPLNDKVISINGDVNDRTTVDVDYSTGNVTIADFGALNGGDRLLSASSSFVVNYTPAVGVTTVGVPKVLTPFGQAFDPKTGTSQGSFSPLLWYYVLDGGTPLSSPVKIGSQILFTWTNGLIALDADPASSDPNVHLRSGKPIDLTKVNHVWQTPLVGGLGIGAPSGDEGSLAINTLGGTNAFTEGLTLVADNSRVMEVNADGAAVWSADGTTGRIVAGGRNPIYKADGTFDETTPSRGRTVLEAKSFSAPQSVRRLGIGDYLVADTGNNRVARFDRAGVTRWSAEQLNDPYGVLAPGDPLRLSTPTDVLTRTLSSFDASKTRIGYEEHYLIADSGNGRVVDVVDYYDLKGLPRTVGATGLSSGIVVWTTRTKSRNGQNLAYHNLQLIAGYDPVTKIAGKPLLVASVGNAGVAASNNPDSTDSSGGSLVQLDYNPYNTGFVVLDTNTNSRVIKYFWAQSEGNLNPYNSAGAPADPEPGNNGGVVLAINELRTVAAGAPTASRKLSGPTYFEQIPLDLNGDGVPESVYLIADANGVYACLVNVDTATKKSYFDVLWQFGQVDYDKMNTSGRLNVGIGGALPRFLPNSVKRLANGNYMITNSASGASSLFESGHFAGEVFEVSLPPIFNGNTTLFDISLGAPPTVTNTIGGGGVAQTAVYANFSVPLIQKTATLNKQQMGSGTNGVSLTEQPHSADRL